MDWFHRFALPVAMILGLLIGAANAASAQTPTQTLRQTQGKLNDLLRRQPKPGSAEERKVQDEIARTVNTLLDFRELARRALGRHWEERSPQEQQEFVDLLRELIERNYVKQLRSNLDYKLEYRQEQVRGQEATVTTVVRVVKNGRTTDMQIDYELRRTDGRWMVYDVITDEVSLVRNYRSQFNRIIKRESYDALVKKMRRKLEEGSQSSS